MVVRVGIGQIQVRVARDEVQQLVEECGRLRRQFVFRRVPAHQTRIRYVTLLYFTLTLLDTL